MAKSSLYTEDWFLSRGYTKNADNSYSPPKLEKGFVGQLNKPTDELKIGSSMVITNPMFNENSPWFKQQIDETTTLGIHSSSLIVFNIEPMGAVRMTKSDTWKLDPFHINPKLRQRKPVTRYFKFKREISAVAKKQNFTLPESDFHAVFIVPMPHSWSQKKKNQMNGSPHKQKPDLDNMIKAVKDSVCDEDKYIWDYRLTKYWGIAGKIIIYPINKLQ